jgi:hypothetical protein
MMAMLGGAAVAAALWGAAGGVSLALLIVVAWASLSMHDRDGPRVRDVLFVLIVVLLLFISGAMSAGIAAERRPPTTEAIL